MKPAISQVCSLHAPFEKDIEDYAGGDCRAIEIWLGKLDEYLERHSTSDVLRLLEANGVVAPVASFQGGLLTSQGAPRKQHWESFAHRLEQCPELNIETLVLAGDVYGPLEQQDLERIQVSFRQAAELAGKHRVRLAFEFHGRATFPNNLQSAAALIAEIASPWLGICLDVFHFYIGASKVEDLAYLSSDNLFHVQLSDLAGVAREWATDADRVLPGDGDFYFEDLVARLRQIDYRGQVSVELMNPQIWRVPPRQFGEIALSALGRILEPAGRP